MTGIENLLTQFIGEDRTLLMLAGFVVLILMNLGAKLALEHKRKNLKWESLPGFIYPVMLYGAFLVGLDILVMVSRDFDIIAGLFVGLQAIGFAAVMAKYFKTFYENLKALGMPVDEKIDEVFESRLGGISEETKADLHNVIDEFISQKEVHK